MENIQMDINDISCYICSIVEYLKLSEKKWEYILDCFEQYYFKNNDINELLKDFTYKDKKINDIVINLLKKSHVLYKYDLTFKDFNIYVSMENELLISFNLFNKRYKIINKEKCQMVESFLLNRKFNNENCF